MSQLNIDRGYITTYTNNPYNVLSQLAINSFTILMIPGYWRALSFLVNNLATFGRSVHQDGTNRDVVHPLNKLLKRNLNLWRSWFHNAAHFGNGYLRILRDPQNNPIGIVNLDPAHVTPYRIDPDDGTGPVVYYFYSVTKEVIQAADMLHLMGETINGWMGINPTLVHYDTFFRARTIDQYSTKYLMRGAMIKGSVEIPGDVKAKQEAEIRDAIRRQHSGSFANDDLLILAGGAKLNNQTISFADSQIIQQTENLNKQMCQIVGVEPSFIYEYSQQKYNGNITEGVNQNVVKYTFRFWIVQAEQQLSEKLLTEAELDQNFSVVIDPSDLLRGDSVSISAINVAQVTAGIISKNAARSNLGYPPDPDPASDKLVTLGDTTPQAARAAALSPAIPAAPNHSAASPAASLAFAAPTPQTALYDAFRPVVAAAAARVDDKAEKAFAAHADKPNLIAWGNTFAESQGSYAVESISEVAAALSALGGSALPLEEIAARYADEIKLRAYGKPFQTLKQILKGYMNHE